LLFLDDLLAEIATLQSRQIARLAKSEKLLRAKSFVYTTTCPAKRPQGRFEPETGIPVCGGSGFPNP
jgi:hypothetical protein